MDRELADWPMSLLLLAVMLGVAFALGRSVRAKSGRSHGSSNGHGAAVAPTQPAVDLSNDALELRHLHSALQTLKEQLEHVEGQRRQAAERLELTKLAKVCTWIFDLKNGELANARATFSNWEALGYGDLSEQPDFARSLGLLVAPEDHEPVMAKVRECLTGRSPMFEAEYRTRLEDGSTRWTLARGLAVRDASGVPIRFSGTSVDITDLKRSEEEARKNKERVELALRGTRVGIYDFEMPDGRIEAAQRTLVNFWELLGLDAETAPVVFDESAAKVLQPADLMLVQEFLAGTDLIWDREFRVPHRDGSERWQLARGILQRDAQGKPVRFTGTAIDITGQKAGEQALRASEARFRATFENAAVGMALTDEQGRLLEYNDRLCEFLGRRRPELVGCAFTELSMPDADTAARQRLVALGGAVSGDQRFLRKDGTHVWGSVSTSVIQHDASGKPTRILSILQDVSQRKRLEEDLRRTKDWLELGMRSSDLGIFDLDMPDGSLESATQTVTNWWELLGYDPATAPRTFPDCAALALPREEQLRLQDALLACLSGAVPRLDLEYQVRHKDGSLQWRLSRGVPVRNGDGTPIRFVGSFVDITAKKQIEARLLESEQRWRSLTDTLPQLVFTTSPDGRADYFNAQALAYIGRPAAELHGQGWSDLVHPDEREHIVEDFISSAADDTVHEVQHRLRRWDGQYRWFNTRAAAAKDGSGRVYKRFGASTDITAFKQLEADLRQAKERLELAIRSSNLSIWEYDMPDGELENARETMTNVWESLGYDAPVHGAPAMAYLIHPEDWPRHADLVQSYLSGASKVFETEHRVLHQDGSHRWFLGRGVALRDAEGRLTRFVGTAVDITQIKSIEAELQRAREAAEAANRAKDDFLANVSHEIRTPMNAILGLTELALDSALTTHQSELLGTVRSAAHNLLGIIDDLLDFSKIAAGKLALDTRIFSVRALLDDTIRALAARAQRKGLELHCKVLEDVPDALLGDAGRLRQVLMNLVGNAIKFTPHGAVTVEVAGRDAPPAKSNPDLVGLHFSVRDTGIGIAPEKQAAIFRAFEQEDSSTTRKYGGTGLGLTISAQLVTLMGGSISVESEPGSGSTFGFTVRLARAASSDLVSSTGADRPVRAAAGSGPTVEALPRLRILVAEDNELNAALLRELLSLAGHRAEFAADGVTALAMAEPDAFDLLLLDLHMPEMDGFDVVQRLRENERRSGQHLPVVALTARSSARDRERCLAAGMDDFLSKPIEARALWATIRRVIEVFPPSNVDASNLLDRGAIMRACGGHASIFEKLCDAFRRSLPEQVAKLRSALSARDAARLSGAAHQLSATLGAFSSVAGDLALMLEDSARTSDWDGCVGLVGRLESMSAQLLADTHAVTLPGI